jgi:hypothetical protein
LVVDFSFLTLVDNEAFLTHAPGRLNEAFSLIRPFHWSVSHARENKKQKKKNTSYLRGYTDRNRLPSIVFSGLAAAVDHGGFRRSNTVHTDRFDRRSSPREIFAVLEMRVVVCHGFPTTG